MSCSQGSCGYRWACSVMVVVILVSDMVRQRSRKESEDSLISKVYLREGW